MMLQFIQFYVSVIKPQLTYDIHIQVIRYSTYLENITNLMWSNVWLLCAFIYKKNHQPNKTSLLKYPEKKIRIFLMCNRTTECTKHFYIFKLFI